MKKNLLPCIFVILFCATSDAQNEILENDLIGTWKLTKALLNGSIGYTPPCYYEGRYTFDGKGNVTETGATGTGCLEVRTDRHFYAVKNDSILFWSTKHDRYGAQILSLQRDTLVLKIADPGYVFIETYTKEE